MSFFDKKEEVLEIELTRHGKEKLMNGEFKPKYYSFHDDGVIYDTNHAGFSEEVSASHDRITKNTAYSKPQSLYSEAGREEQDIRAQEILPNNNKIGTIDLSTKYGPAFEVKMIDGRIENISNISGSLSGSNNNIPQINLEDLEFDVVTGYTGADEQNQDDQFSIGISREFPDGTTINIRQKQILLALLENNTPLKNDNFEIEIFEVSEKDNDEKVLDKKEFALNRGRQESFVEFFVPEQSGSIEEIDRENVEFFLDIKTDDEISKQELCEKISEDDKDIFSDDLECGDSVTNKNISDETERIYDSNVDNNDTVDKC